MLFASEKYLVVTIQDNVPVICTCNCDNPWLCSIIIYTVTVVSCYAETDCERIIFKGAEEKKKMRKFLRIIIQFLSSYARVACYVVSADNQIKCNIYIWQLDFKKYVQLRRTSHIFLVNKTEETLFINSYKSEIYAYY